jgi:hypothetical protein
MNNIEKIAKYVQATNPHFPHDDKGRYMLLGRLQQDAEYFIRNPHNKHLWSGNVKDHIQDMKELYNGFKEKPQWITMNDILKYEKEMIKAEQRSASLKMAEGGYEHFKGFDGYGKKVEEFFHNKTKKTIAKVKKMNVHLVGTVYFLYDDKGNTMAQYVVKDKLFSIKKDLL